MKSRDRDELSFDARELIALERSRRETNPATRARAFARVTSAAGGAAVGFAAIAAKAAASANPASGAAASAGAAAGQGVAAGGGVAAGAGSAGTTGAAFGGASVAAKLGALGSTKIAAIVIAASVASGVGAAALFQQPAETPAAGPPSAAHVTPMPTTAGVGTSVTPSHAITTTSATAPPELPPKPVLAAPTPMRAAPPARAPEPIATTFAAPAPPPTTTTSSAARSATDPPTTHPLEAERRLIDGARTALLRGDTASALASADEHAQRFPRGQLVAEREALAVRALVRSGRVAEARVRARRFVEEHPNHALGEVIERAARGPDETR